MCNCDSFMTTPATTTEASVANAEGTPLRNSSLGAAPPQTKRSRAKPQGANRIDSTQVPSPCRDLPEAAGAARSVFQTSKGIPPHAFTNYLAQDDGNANPKFIRPSLHAVPHEESFLRESGLIWSSVICPLAPVLSEEAVPVIADRLPVRCHRCRAYINPFAPFTELGRRWTCMFCGMSNDVDAAYFCNIDPSGKRRDASDKAELCRGSVTWDVTSCNEYVHKDTVSGRVTVAAPMRHLVAIEVSRKAQSTLSAVSSCLKGVLRDMSQRYPMCQVSFVTFADTLHFYNFSVPSVPQLIVTDVESPFVPLPFTMLCWMNVVERLDDIEAFLDRLPSISEACDETGSCLGAAVKSATLICADSGGQLVVLASQAPTSGCGIMPVSNPHRDAPKLHGTENEKVLFRPLDGFWPSLAAECAARQVTVDLVALLDSYADLASIGQVCHITNGCQSLLKNFSAPADEARLHAILWSALCDRAGFAGVLKTRTSAGIKIKGYHGHFLSQEAATIDLAGLRSTSSFVVDFAHDGKIDAKSHSFIQCAVLFTSREGRRLVMVHTLKLTVANTYAALFRNADLESTLQTFCCHALHEAVNKGTKVGRDWCNSKLLEILVGYRKYCSTSSHSGQLLLPEQLKLLPVLLLSLWKSDALVPGAAVQLDDRVQCMFDLLTMQPSRIIAYLYPRLFAVQSILSHSHAGLPFPFEPSGGCYLPPPLQLTADNIFCHGIYLLHDQQAHVVYLWIGSAVTAKTSQSLFNTENAQTVTEFSFDQWNDRLRAVIRQLVRHEGGVDKFCILHEKRDAAEDAFFRCLMEDEWIQGIPCYSENLCALHKSINLKLA